MFIIVLPLNVNVSLALLATSVMERDPISIFIYLIYIEVKCALIAKKCKEKDRNGLVLIRS